MNILIATPLYPPDLGGPASYALHLEDQFQRTGHHVRICRFRFEKKLSAFVRHFFYFFRILPHVLWADSLLVLDASSVGVPAVWASVIFRKRSVVRLGGDFLWEQYVQRTGNELSLKSFYEQLPPLTIKEVIVKRMIRWTIRHADAVVVNTEWFSEVLVKGYDCDASKVSCIENHFAGIGEMRVSNQKTFVASSRNIRLKNIGRLQQVFQSFPATRLVTETVTGAAFEKTLSESYATAVVSFSDVNPNMVLEGLSKGKPFLLTQHTGLHPRFKNMGVFVDPFDEASIKKGVLLLLDESYYQSCIAAIASCRYAHSWKAIAEAFERLLA